MSESPRNDADQPAGHGGVLTIDLAALAANYRELARRASGAETAAAVKGDAYGIGLEPAARALHRAGCRTFFVAHLGEAEALRAICPRDAVIYVLNGLLPGMGPQLARIDARPVLGSLDEIDEWRAFAAGNRAPRAAIQIDTGFTRLGLSRDDVAKLSSEPGRLEGVDLALVMSHLACADEPDNPMNTAQLALFREARAAFPRVPASLANSGGILAGRDFHFDLVRPGIALYGARAISGGDNPMAPVVSLDVPILQVRDAAPGTTAGYGATYRFAEATRVALVSIGYADGFLRAAGATTDKPGARLFVAGHPAPIVGRVSMDITAIDVSQVPDRFLMRGAMVEVVGANQTIDDLAEAAGTIGYELLTRLGLRHSRVYSGA